MSSELDRFLRQSCEQAAAESAARQRQEEEARRWHNRPLEDVFGPTDAEMCRDFLDRMRPREFPGSDTLFRAGAPKPISFQAYRLGLTAGALVCLATEGRVCMQDGVKLTDQMIEGIRIGDVKSNWHSSAYDLQGYNWEERFEIETMGLGELLAKYLIMNGAA